MNNVGTELRLTVLVVEDETLVRMFLSDVLDETGFKVFEAVNADEAAAVLQARPDIQVVVTDVELPGSMNGFELTKVIRKRWPGIGLIVNSGRRRPAPDELPEDIPFITKPYLPETIVALIRRMTTPQAVEPTSALPSGTS